jgi:hypothetical protein
MESKMHIAGLPLTYLAVSWTIKISAVVLVILVPKHDFSSIEVLHFYMLFIACQKKLFQVNCDDNKESSVRRMNAHDAYTRFAFHLPSSCTITPPL